MMLTTGKRGVLQAQRQADVAVWAKHFGIPAPIVRVRQKRGANYYARLHTMFLSPESSRRALVHEFAHHLAAVTMGKRGHGPAFRIALVQVATIAYGRADKYPWAEEGYQTVKAWAKKHDLLKVA